MEHSYDERCRAIGRANRRLDEGWQTLMERMEEATKRFYERVAALEAAIEDGYREEPPRKSID